MKKIKIGTRGSKLALFQANYIKELLINENPLHSFEIVIIKTKGDKILDTPLSKINDKGLFTKELETSLKNNEIDLIVHSMKDVPTEIEDSLIISAITKREISNDVFISNKYKSFLDLPASSKIGTSSLRRKSQLSSIRQDLDYIDIRGNVDTRLNKLDNEEYDAIILAYAGIKRLGLENRITEKLDFSICLPAVGQGAIGIETRKNDFEINDIVNKINDLETSFCVSIERVFLKKLNGGCQVPIGSQAYFQNNKLNIQCFGGNLDGTKIIKDSRIFDFNLKDLEKIGNNFQKYQAEEFGDFFAKIFLKSGFDKISNELRLNI